MPADRLIVLLSGEPVGVLTSSGDGRGTIEYLPDVVERSADLPLLSLSLRVRREPYSADADQSIPRWPAPGRCCPECSGPPLEVG